MSSFTILSFFGGVMLLLYGMSLAGESMQRLAGARLRSILFAATGNRLRATAVGAAVTALFQSSSATTVMLVGFAGAGLIGLRQTMGVILGADIGTTLTVQIIAFKVYDYAVILVGLGGFLRFVAKGGRLRDTGQSILGFAFVFLALKILIDTFAPLAGDPLLAEVLGGLDRDPLAGVIISTVITALLHSSAATLGLAMTAASSGLMSVEAVVPAVLGANIGTCISAVTSSIGAEVPARRVALAHILFKLCGVAVALPFIGPFAHIVEALSSDPARQIAVAHTLFNIAIAAIFLPFIGPFARLIETMVPDRGRSEKFGPRYLDDIVLSSPSLALGQAAREALRTADIVQEMLRGSLEVLRGDDMELLERVEERDNEVDLLEKEIKLYVARLSRESLSEEQVRRELEILTFINNLENIGDVIDKNLMELARKKINRRLSFSSDGMAEITALHGKVMENFEISVGAFTNSDVELARRLLARKAKFAEMEREMRQAHIDRLRRGLRESIDTSAIHLDVLTNLKRINSYTAGVAYQILEREKGA